MASRLGSWYQLILVFLAQGAAASLSHNVTIDDTDPSVHYSKNWNTGCPQSVMCADLSKAYNGTLHWALPSLVGSDTITIQFFGTAVYVYNILTNFPSHIAFTLDGSPVAPYYKSGKGKVISKYFYRQLVYANDSLSNEGHVLVIGGEGLIIFDYVKLTSSNGPPPTLPPSTSPPLPPQPPSAQPMSLSSPTSQELSTTLTVTTTTSRLYTLTTRFSVRDRFYSYHFSGSLPKVLAFRHIDIYGCGCTHVDGNSFIQRGIQPLSRSNCRSNRWQCLRIDFACSDNVVRAPAAPFLLEWKAYEAFVG